MSVLEQLKELLEVDVQEDIFDTQLLLYANGGIAYLINNGVPLSRLTVETKAKEFKLKKPEHYDVVLSWLHLYCLQRFDRTLMTQTTQTTLNWINEEMTDLLYQLKVFYDRSDLSEI